MTIVIEIKKLCFKPFFLIKLFLKKILDIKDKIRYNKPSFRKETKHELNNRATKNF